MKRKKILGALFAFLLLPGTIFAKDVTVDGFGVDRSGALRDAERMAVESVVGTYIDSRTLVENAVVALDEIYAKSEGYVTNVKVIQEGASEGSYKVRAIVSVSENQNDLVSRLQMIARLNDPRIAVVVLREGQNTHEKIIESAMNERLISLGFRRVVDANIVSALHDAQMLRSLYNGQPVTRVGSNYGADFAVISMTSVSSNNISIPDFKGGYVDSGFHSGRAEMATKIIRLDTGDILETFTVEGRGTMSEGGVAEQAALKDMAVQAAQKVEEKFRKIGGRSSGNVQVVVGTQNYALVQQLANDLKAVPGVQNVFVREQANGKAILELDTNQSAHAIIEMLRNRTSLGIFIDSISGNSAKIMIS